MERKTPENEWDEIGRIVREELEAASRLVPEESRKAHLRARIAAESPKRRKRGAWFLKPVPVLTTSLILVAVVVVMRSLWLVPKQAISLPDAVMKYLQASPEIRSVIKEQGRERRPENQPGDSEGFGSVFERLFSAGPSSKTRETTTPSLTAPRAPEVPLSLEETIRILFFDRSLEKYLTEFSKKSQEG
jgi:hypothetical protein